MANSTEQQSYKQQIVCQISHNPQTTMEPQSSQVQGTTEYNIGVTISVRSHENVCFNSTILQIVHETSTNSQ
jgi:hypothetical protein